jgi:hypothetical protein
VRVHDLDRRSQIATLEAGVVNSVSFLGDSHRLVTGSSDRNVVAWRMFPKAQDLVDATKSKAPRCLTQSQRQEYFLTAAPPIWCVERRLWPYHSAEWYDKWLPKQKAWLKSGRRDDPPSLPKLK